MSELQTSASTELSTENNPRESHEAEQVDIAELLIILMILLCREK